MPPSRFDNLSTPVARATGAATAAPPINNNQPVATAAPRPTVAVVSGIGTTYASRSYSLVVLNASRGQDGRSIMLEVHLENSLNRDVPYRVADFQMFNSVNGRLTLDTKSSSLAAGGNLSIPAGSEVAV